MDQLTSILIWGLATSGLYAMMAVGVTLIFGVSRIINFAHGAFFTLGAYFCFVFFSWCQLPIAVAILLALAATAVVAVAFDHWFIGPVRDRLVIVWMMTFAFAFAIREVLVLAFGARPYSLPPLIPGSATIFAQAISWQRLLIIAVSMLALGALWWFLNRSRVGKSLQAVAQNVQAAHLVGIPVRWANSIVMAISAALAALAGILVAPIGVISPDMGLDALLMAFTVVILGGIGSVKGTVAAALIVGYATSTVSFLISPQFVTFAALTVVFAVILVRPNGLFGLALEERA